MYSVTLGWSVILLVFLLLFLMLSFLCCCISAVLVDGRVGLGISTAGSSGVESGSFRCRYPGHGAVFRRLPLLLELAGFTYWVSQGKVTSNYSHPIA